MYIVIRVKFVAVFRLPRRPKFSLASINTDRNCDLSQSDDPAAERTAEMLAHLVIGSNDVEASKRFYDPVLSTLGVPAGDYNAERQRLYYRTCLLYTSPSPRDRTRSRMPSSA